MVRLTVGELIKTLEHHDKDADIRFTFYRNTGNPDEYFEIDLIISFIEDYDVSVHINLEEE